MGGEKWYRFYMLKRGQLRKWKPLTPGTRHRVSREGLYDGVRTVPKHLRYGVSRTGGRNHHGHITNWHQGGGPKRLIRQVVSRQPGQTGWVVGLQYDPFRRAPIAIRATTRQDPDTNMPSWSVFAYVIAGEAMNLGDRVTCEIGPDYVNANQRTLLSFFHIGASVYELGWSWAKKAQWIKAPGTSGTVMAHDVRTSGLTRTLVQLPSGEQRWFDGDHTLASFGSVVAQDAFQMMEGKAGRTRAKGVRPTVRGVAMNPVDHPHGGRTKGGRHDVTPWARTAKGRPTVRKTVKWKIIVKSRRDGSKKSGSKKG